MAEYLFIGGSLVGLGLLAIYVVAPGLIIILYRTIIREFHRAKLIMWLRLTGRL